MKKPTKTRTLYAAKKYYGGDGPILVYFETIKERNAYIKANDYVNIAGTVKLTENEFNMWKASGHWLPDFGE